MFKESQINGVTDSKTLFVFCDFHIHAHYQYVIYLDRHKIYMTLYSVYINL